MTCAHSDFTEAMDGSRTCTDCGEVYEPADDDGPHYAGCVCATCSDAELTSGND